VSKNCGHCIKHDFDTILYGGLTSNQSGKEDVPYNTDTKRHLPVLFPVLIKTTLTLPVLGLVKGGIPAITARTMGDDPLVIHLDQVLEKKFEGCRNVRVIACGLYKLLSDHRVCVCIARLLYDSVDYVK